MIRTLEFYLFNAVFFLEMTLFVFCLWTILYKIPVLLSMCRIGSCCMDRIV